MRLASVLALALALPLAGCTAGEGLGFGGAAEGAREPYYKEWRSFVDGSHLMLYSVPVEADADAVNVTLLLVPRTNGLPLPDLVLAKLDVSVSDPNGASVLQGEVDVQRRVATLVLQDPAPGEYIVQVSGIGTSEEIDGTRYGDAYTLSVEVTY